MTPDRTLALQGAGRISTELVDRTINLAFKQLRLGKNAAPDVIERVVDLVGSGALDAAIEASAPPVELQRVKRRFDEQKEFSHEAWSKRHGLGA